MRVIATGLEDADAILTLSYRVTPWGVPRGSNELLCMYVHTIDITKESPWTTNKLEQLFELAEERGPFGKSEWE